MPYSIAMICRSSRSFQRQTLRGALDFAAESGSVDLIGFEADAPTPLDPHIAGVIGVFTAEVLPLDPWELDEKRRPVVNTSNSHTLAGIGRVITDDLLVGRMGASYLLNQGYRHQAFVVERRGTRLKSDLLRSAGWRRTMRASGAVNTPVQALDDPAFNAFLSTSPRPLGILASQDSAAVALIRRCRQIGVRVPEDVAVLGINDEDLLCESIRPTLSSIDVNRRQVGYEAAAEVLRALTDPSWRPRTVRIPPARVVQRQSTRAVASEDPLTRRALTWIDQHKSESPSVEELADELNVCRRTLELVFRRELGRTPRAEIDRARIDHIQAMLIKTDLPLKAIAAACGFTDQRYFSTMFRRHAGCTPTAYRQRHHGG